MGKKSRAKKERHAVSTSKVGQRFGYHKIPKVEGCIRCGGCCGLIAIHMDEVEAIDHLLEKKGLKKLGDKALQFYQGIANGTIPDSLDCPFLTPDGCAVYEARPFLCRLFGAAKHKNMRCPKGASAERPLSPKIAEKLSNAYQDAIIQRIRQDELLGISSKQRLFAMLHLLGTVHDRKKFGGTSDLMELESAVNHLMGLK